MFRGDAESTASTAVGLTGGTAQAGVPIEPLGSPLRHSAKRGKLKLNYDPTEGLGTDEWPETAR